MAIATKCQGRKPTAMARHQERSHRIRDFLLYIAIGVLVVVLIGLLGVHQAKTGQKPEVLLKWIGFAVMTLLVFWWAIRAYRPFWANARFWRLIALFAAIHVILGVGLLLRTTMVSLFPFVAITPLEYFLLSACLSRFLIQKE
jgi:cation transport ATPase